ncbi:MAG TPA: class I SAM-dependent methyltransferase [Phototrophicaceae bacterium]|nr:class I SAM-dependent methyltransferase [Phototrophicaceae bacterium]
MNLIQNQCLQLDLLARLGAKPPYFEPSAALFWDDPYIAQQMLKAHLDPNVDAASRKPETIDKIVQWISTRLGLQAGARLLDLGCGPGLYTRRFAERGLIVTGMDMSENSLRYAREHDTQTTYLHANYVHLAEENAFEVVTLIYGDFCVLNDANRDKVLQNIARALRPGGYFVFDVTTPRHRDNQKSPSNWYISTGAGFWKPTPHLVLTQYHTYPEQDTGLDQYLVIEDSGAVTEYRVWTHNYTPETIAPVLAAQGFDLLDSYGDLTGIPYMPTSEWAGFVARKV